MWWRKVAENLPKFIFVAKNGVLMLMQAANRGRIYHLRNEE
jgi:hypothetical protein